MTKQEEVKTGLKGLRMSKRNYNGKNYPSFLSPDDVGKILAYLHSHGVVIKVVRELPGKEGVIFSYGTGDDGIWDESQEAMIEAGYVAVEPLI